ncbi:GMC family oxidoreductase [Saccharothrix luteola]|uniref:GMC family oxidoreductase n=1 Tax=Saccharothrix luteola TaxID=2893018 RepID=UPI001E32CDD6|nr:GMC family oxidoreductase N-terminal domain-containing protein [Saccharothrix luteola]MCC8251496.1 GMC family oxidoreductase N-terminal domain-containing protein [Saccharothrix luteola]
MYDYVIVGGGSAGCVLAARLTEDPDVTVCVVEAGPLDTVENIHVPAGFAKLFRTGVDWDYDTHDEPGLNGRRVFLPQGRVLGGTSSINSMIYVRGNPLDFDAWGQPGWGFDDLLGYFLRSEDNDRGESAFHGVGGPLGVSDNRARNPMSTAFLAAAAAAGFAANDDFNGPAQDGFGYFQVNQRDGRRSSAATAFLHPVLHRPNLTLEANLQTHRVLVEGGRATGVVGFRAGEEITVRAEREVVLAAGAYNSPQLLMLSGIGPAAMLGALNIPVVLDQPLVGQNLQDHALVPLVYTHRHPISMLAAGAPESVHQFVTEGRGPLTSNGPEAGGFVRTLSGLPAPDVEFLTAPVMIADSGLAAPTAHAITLGASLLTPLSRGHVSLGSDDPTAKPRIVHNYYADPADLDTAVRALRIALEIAGTAPLEPYTETAFRPPASTSEEDLRAYARARTQSTYHPVGTCAMGQVVDAELRVMGVEGLRVVDASVMPTITRGNTNAPVIAIAEKAADLISGAPALPARGTEALAA